MPQNLVGFRGLQNARSVHSEADSWYDVKIRPHEIRRSGRVLVLRGFDHSHIERHFEPGASPNQYRQNIACDGKITINALKADL